MNTHDAYGTNKCIGNFSQVNLQSCLGDHHLETLILYLDDILVFAPTFGVMLDRFAMAFRKLKNYALKLISCKYILMQRNVKYLGHVVSKEGISTDPDKTTDVFTWPTPKTISELRSFLGLGSYYRRQGENIGSYIGTTETTLIF